MGEQDLKNERAQRKEAVNTVLELKSVVNRYQVGRSSSLGKSGDALAYGRGKRTSDIYDGRNKSTRTTAKDVTSGVAASFARNHKFTDGWFAKRASAPLLRSPVNNVYLDPRLKPLARGPGFRDPRRTDLEM